MKFKFILIRIFILVLFYSSGLFAQTSTTYYICDCQEGADSNCIAGDDNNNGTNPGTPWQTYQKAQSQFGSIQAGDKVLFARGGSFNASSARWVNYNSSGSNPITIGDYTPPWTSGDEGRPILKNPDDGIFRFEDGGNADHDEGYILKNLVLKGNNNGWAIFLYNDVDDLLMDNIEIDSFSIGVHCGGSNTPNPGSNGRNDSITLRNSRITNCPGQGWLGGGKDILIENNEFENNGYGQAVFNHNIYVSNSENVTIRNNDLYKSAVIDGECKGVSMVIHGIMSGLVIEYNTVHEDFGAAGGGCWGIAVDPGYSSAEDFRGSIIRGNVVMNVGNVAIGTTSCPDCVIENNVIIQEQSDFGTIGIAVPDRTRSSDDTPDSNITVQNNTVFMNNAANSSTGVKVSTEGSSHVVVNNIVVNTGTNSNFSAFNTTSLDASDFEAFDNNLAYFPNSTNAKWEKNTGTLEDWQSATGFDQHSFLEDPLFTSIEDSVYDLSLSENSPAVNTGSSIYYSELDITGNTRDSQPDIGAYEYRDTVNDAGGNQIAEDFYLSQNYPNPFNPATKMKYQVSRSELVSLKVYDILGREVATLVNEEKPVGSFVVEFNASNLPSGIYFYTLKAGDFVKTKKMILLK